MIEYFVETWKKCWWEAIVGYLVAFVYEAKNIVFGNKLEGRSLCYCAEHGQIYGIFNSNECELCLAKYGGI